METGEEQESVRSITEKSPMPADDAAEVDGAGDSKHLLSSPFLFIAIFQRFIGGAGDGDLTGTTLSGGGWKAPCMIPFKNSGRGRGRRGGGTEDDAEDEEEDEEEDEDEDD